MESKLDLSGIKAAGIYSVETNPFYNKSADIFYYALYIDIHSWGPRLKTLITKRLYQNPVWLLIDDGEYIRRVLVENLEQFRGKLVPEIEELLKK